MIHGKVDASGIAALLGMGGDGTIEDGECGLPIRATGEGEQVFHGKSVVGFFPSCPAIIRAPDAVGRAGKASPFIDGCGQIEVKAEGLASRSIAARPSFSTVEGKANALIHSDQKSGGIARIDGNFTLRFLARKWSEQVPVRSLIVTDLDSFRAAGGVDGARIGRMKGGAAIRISPHMIVTEHAPILSSVGRKIGGAHVAVQHHQPGICRADRGAKHGSSTGKAKRFPLNSRRLSETGSGNKRGREQQTPDACQPHVPDR